MQNYNIIKIPQKTYLKNAADFVDTIFVGNLSAFNISCHSCCLLKYTQYDKKKQVRKPQDNTYTSVISLYMK